MSKTQSGFGRTQSGYRYHVVPAQVELTSRKLQKQGGRSNLCSPYGSHLTQFAWPWPLLPIVGQAPSDALIGFLPPNNGSSGQGFVQFSIRPKRDVMSLAVIDAEATIYFDENEPIDTPPIFNTVSKIQNKKNCALGHDSAL